MIPASALAALVAPAVLRPEGRVELLSAEVVACLAALAVMWRTRNVLATLAVGLGLVVVLSAVL